MQTDPITLGQRIAGLRRAHGWSQRRLAEAAGVSHGYIAQLELGHLPSPGKFRLDAIARALDLRTSDALLETSPPSYSGYGAGSSASPARTGAAGDGVSGDGINGIAEPSFAAANVLGGIADIRPAWARPLPVFRWGSCGDPRDRESPPDPDRLEFPPPGHESLIGPNGFGVVVKGESMVGRGIFDGDVVWVNPERPYQLGKVVLALVTDVSGESGMVVKTYARGDVGECLMSEPAQGQRSPVVCRDFRVIGPVVGITSWRLPG